MDALALLSDAEASDDEALSRDGAREPHCEEQSASPSGLRLEDLERGGYQPADLLSTDAYLNDAAGQEARRVKLPGATAAVDKTPTEGEAKDSTAPQPEQLQSPEQSSLEVAAAKRGSLCAQEVKIFQYQGASRPVPGPWKSFRSSDGENNDGFPAKLYEPLALVGIDEPTPIQAHAFPILAQGRDLIGLAQTGSGKTLAYLLPCLSKVLQPKVATGRAATGFPSILVLGPTRELVCQVAREAERFQRSADLRVAAIYGGGQKAPQQAALRARPHLVVATPGRLIDLLDTAAASCSVHSVRSQVLDEADRMLDEGFEPQIRKIVEQIGPKAPERQTLLFSATWPARVRQLGEEFLEDPVEIRIGAVDELRTNPDIAQDIMFVSEDAEKPDALVSLLNGRPKDRSIVFVATKRSCRSLERSLAGRIRGSCGSVHGDKSQQEREATLKDFRDSNIRVLFATDVAGRGLDVPGVALVVNFDPPQSAEDYVHRVGRTGRAGAKGLATSILTWRDTEAMRFIAGVMRKSDVPLPPELAVQLGLAPPKQPVIPAKVKRPFPEPWANTQDPKCYKKADLVSAVSKLWS